MINLIFNFNHHIKIDVGLICSHHRLEIIKPQFKLILKLMKIIKLNHFWPAVVKIKRKKDPFMVSEGNCLKLGNISSKTIY